MPLLFGCNHGRCEAYNMSEASFWDYLRKLLPKEGHYTRIESHDTAPGFPDVHYTLSGNSGVIELKDAKRPGAKYPFRGKSGLRASQITWMNEYLAADGDRAFLALQCGDRVYLLRAELYYDELHRMTEDDINRVATVKWKKGERRGTSEDNAYSLNMALRDLLEGTL